MKRFNNKKSLTIIIILVLSIIQIMPTQAEPIHQEVEATLHLTNNTEQSICNMYISPSTAPTWGADQLGTDIIEKGQPFLLTLPSGNYDIRLEDCQENVLFEKYNLTISGTYQLSVTVSTCLLLKQKAEATYSQTNHSQILSILAEALHCYQTVDNHLEEALIFNRIATIYEEQGQYEKALENYKYTLNIWQRTSNRTAIGTTLNNMGSIHHSQGQYETALAQFQEALAIRQEIADRLGEGQTLNNIGAVYHSLGHYKRALQHYEQALEIRREVRDRAGEGTTINNIGAVYRSWGQYEIALEHFQQALEIAEIVGDRPGEGTSLNNIAEVYRNQGRYQEALQNFQDALVIRQELSDYPGQGITLNNIGSIHYSQGQYTESLESFADALVIQRVLNDRAGEGTTLNNIGTIFHSQGLYKAALENYQEALAIRQALGDRAGEGATLNNIGAVYRHQGQYEKALESFHMALDILTQIGNRAEQGLALDNIGGVYDSQRRYDEALNYYQQAITILESVRSEAGSEIGRTRFIEQHFDLYNRTITLQLQAGQDAQVFVTSEQGRARAFLDSLATGTVQLSDDEGQQALLVEREAYAVRQSLEDRLAQSKTTNSASDISLAKLEVDLVKAEQAHAEALAAIEAQGDQLATLVPGRSTTLSLAEIQALLDKETTLVSYWVQERDKGTLAFIITQDTLTVVHLPEATRDYLTTTITNLHDWLNRDNAHPRPLRNLHTRLVAPLQQHLQTQRVGIIPHQLLHYVPFAALTDGKTYLGQTHTLFFLPSASALRFIQQNVAGLQQASQPTLVFGNPTTGNEAYPSLPHAAIEAHAVGELFDKAAVYTETAASEARLYSGIGGAPVVHLAAHGNYDVSNQYSSAIHLASSSEETDGRLEVREVYGLNLNSAELVTLSACQTNVGEIVEANQVISAGDDIIGLTRAFFFAGTPTVISSLWQVDDAATEQLMVAFYHHWQAGMGKAQALQAAQAQVRQTYPSPFYWAGFVLSGDPGTINNQEILTPTSQPTPLPPSSNNRICIGSSALLIFPLLFVGSRKGKKRSSKMK